MQCATWAELIWLFMSCLCRAAWVNERNAKEVCITKNHSSPSSPLLSLFHFSIKKIFPAVLLPASPNRSPPSLSPFFNARPLYSFAVLHSSSHLYISSCYHLWRLDCTVFAEWIVWIVVRIFPLGLLLVFKSIRTVIISPFIRPKSSASLQPFCASFFFVLFFFFFISFLSPFSFYLFVLLLNNLKKIRWFSSRCVSLIPFFLHASCSSIPLDLFPPFPSVLLFPLEWSFTVPVVGHSIQFISPFSFLLFHFLWWSIAI